MNARPMIAVATPRNAMERFCVATFFSNAVSAVSREISDPDVTPSKKATSCARMLVNSLIVNRKGSVSRAMCISGIGIT